jgi:hypothetical protein
MIRTALSNSLILGMRFLRFRLYRAVSPWPRPSRSSTMSFIRAPSRQKVFAPFDQRATPNSQPRSTEHAFEFVSDFGVRISHTSEAIHSLGFSFDWRLCFPVSPGGCVVPKSPNPLPQFLMSALDVLPALGSVLRTWFASKLLFAPGLRLKASSPSIPVK